VESLFACLTESVQPMEWPQGKIGLYNPNKYQRVDSSNLWFTWLSLRVGVDKVMKFLDKLCYHGKTHSSSIFMEVAR
jgi:hypothetical protein